MNTSPEETESPQREVDEGQEVLRAQWSTSSGDQAPQKDVDAEESPSPQRDVDEGEEVLRAQWNAPLPNQPQEPQEDADEN
jgi:hypothetical protein